MFVEGGKTDELSLLGAIAWLETKDPNEQYDFNDCNGACLYSQYMAAKGYSIKEYFGAKADSPIEKFETLIYAKVANRGLWTFGAALERARAAL